MKIKFNSANSLFEFDIYTEDSVVKIFVSIFRYSKTFNTGVIRADI